MESITLKTCCTCKQEFPATSEHFHKDKRRPDGLYRRCKKCQNQAVAASARKHADTKRVQNQRYRAANREKVRGWAKEGRLRNLEAVRQRGRVWREKNVEKRQKSLHLWRQNNKERVALRRKEWNSANPLNVRLWSVNRWARVHGVDEKITIDELSRLVASQDRKCFYCKEPLADNLQFEHVVPLSRGGRNTIDNLVCACPGCNLSKSNKLLAEWQGRRPRREVDREKCRIRRTRLRIAGGSYSANDIRRQLKAQNGKCWWCGEKLASFEADHRVPVVRNGHSNPSNIVLSCRGCNNAKSDKMPHEFNGRLL